MPKPLQDYPDPYAAMGTSERLVELAKGAGSGLKYMFTEPKAYAGHLDAPEIFARMLRERYPELGAKRINRGALDAAINFAGGYDWAMRPEVSAEDARNMALRYQLRDYMKPGRKGSDEVADYAQNLAGVEQALADRAKNVKRERNEIAALAKQFAEQETEQGRVLRKAEGGRVGYDPALVQSIVDRVNAQFMAEGGPALPADRATGYKPPGAQPDDRLARFGGSFLSSLPGAAKGVATGYVDMLSALNNYLYQLEPEEQIALLKKLPAGIRDAVLRGVESVKQIPEKVAAATPESAGQFGAQLTAEMLLDPTRLGKGVPKAEIIKKPGGNWEAGSVERVVKPLYPKAPTNRDEALMLGGRWARDVDTPEAQELMRQNAAMSDWLDKKLKTYIKNDMATERDPVRLGIEQRLTRAQEEKAKADLRNAKTREKISAARAQGKNTTAAERQLEQDIVDAEQKYKLDQAAASHMRLDPQTIAANQLPSDSLMARRVSAGAPPENLATTGLSTFWEKRTDVTLGIPKDAGDAVDPNFWLEPGDYENFVQKNPWALKVPPNTKIYSIQPNFERALQLDHLRDELEFALYDRANLPPELRLTPEDLSKMNMDAAVAHVGKMNAWRERNKVAANLLKSRNAATVTFKEYPDAGLEWKELKMPEPKLEEGHFTRYRPEVEMWGIFDPQEGTHGMGVTEAEALGLYKREERTKLLQEALGYEGDVMGHCVGGRGYCDKITSGTGRIFSLRDAKGEPHVTIEVRPGGKKIVAEYDEEELRRAAESQSWRVKDAGDPREIEEIYDEVYQQLIPEFASYGDEADEILQIKGKGNLKPADKYLPFVQDFVRSQKWGNVKDLYNADMNRLDQGGPQATALRARNIEVPRYVTKEQKKALDDWIDSGKWLQGGMPEGFAHGGAVKMAAGGKMGYNAAAVDAIVQRLSEKLNG